MATREEQYETTVSNLRTWHGELLRMEREGQFDNARENPALIGSYLTKLRLNCNLLYSFMNDYLDMLNVGIQGVAEKRQNLYEAQLKMGKSASASETHSKEMTRIDDANVKILENKLMQIKNEYERYNGICISLQSRMKEFDTERRMG